MRLLIDNQLPPALARYLETLGWKALHVADLGLDSATDSAIWQYALQHDMVIVSKDQDFQLFADRQRGIPPQVVWVRLGNCRHKELFSAFARHSSAIRHALSAGRAVVELR